DRVMDDLALIGVHRFEGFLAPGPADPRAHVPGHPGHLRTSPLPVVLHVDQDPATLARLVQDHPAHEVLHPIERGAMATDQETDALLRVSGPYIDVRCA